MFEVLRKSLNLFYHLTGIKILCVLFLFIWISPASPQGIYDIPAKHNADDTQFLKDLLGMNSIASQYSPATIGEQTWNKKTGRLERLIISYTGISTIPPTITKAASLHYLDLSHNQIKNIPTDLYSCSAIDTLILDNNSISWLPDTNYTVHEESSSPITSGVPGVLGSAIDFIFGGSTKYILKGRVYIGFRLMTNLRYLSLNNNSIANLRDGLVYLTNLEYLSVSGNDIKTLPQHNYDDPDGYIDYVAKVTTGWWVFKSTTTHTLINKRTKYPAAKFKYLSRLKYLDVSGNGNFKGLSEDDVMDMNLEQLNISGGAFTSLPNSIGSLGRLKILTATYGKLSSLPATINYLRNLITLNLEKNYISQLPPDWNLMDSLQNLIVSKNALATIPQGLNRLPNIKYITFSDNHISVLPSGMNRLSPLKSLDLSGNQVKSLPYDFAGMKNLQSLSLANNQLTSLPDNIGSSDSLASFVLSYNKLVTLPSSFGNLHNLRVLNLDNNNLESLPATFGNIGDSLVVIDLSYNKLTTLPDSYGKLRGLQLQTLENNMFIYLPESFCRLPNIRTLSLKNNLLQSLPENISEMRLVSIDLTNNKLTKLPDSFAKFDSLYFVNLDDNLFTEIPMVFTKTDSIIASLSIQHNFLKSIPEEFSKAKIVNLNLTGNDLYCGDNDFQDVDGIPYFLTKLSPDTSYLWPTVVTGLYNQRCMTPTKEIRPNKFSMYTPYPNPFNPSTTIHFSTIEDGHVEVNIYNILGEKVSSVINEFMPKGYHKVIWAPSDIASGTYIVAIISGGKMDSKKMQVLK